MKIYLAGAITGNINAFWKHYAAITSKDSCSIAEHDKMKIYLAGTYSRDYVIKEAMKIFLEGNDGYRKLRFKETNLYILESFYYIVKQEWMFPILKHFKGFLLDSGAFTYMQGNGDKVNWDEYIEQYAAFINAHDIKDFFELDIDSIVGLKKVELLRAKLEMLTNRQCIPVFHRSRGKEYWTKMCQQYKYVAIGGIVGKEIKRTEYDIFNYLLREAAKYKSNVHGLGFTNLTGITKYPFYSVDSTAWLYGNRSGFVYMFNGHGLDKVQAPTGMRLHSKESAMHNFNEWVKFQKWSESNL